MRTTLALDDDVRSMIEAEKLRTGETGRQVVNRLLRRAMAREAAPGPALRLPLLPGRPRIDITDTSAVIAELDDEEAVERGLQ